MPYSTVLFRMTLSDLAKYSMTRSVARSFCDSWASCCNLITKYLYVMRIRPRSIVLCEQWIRRWCVNRSIVQMLVDSSGRCHVRPTDLRYRLITLYQRWICWSHRVAVTHDQSTVQGSCHVRLVVRAGELSFAIDIGLRDRQIHCSCSAVDLSRRLVDAVPWRS